MPSEYSNELGLYYFGKMKMSHVNPKRALRMSPDGKFPDVFSQAWEPNYFRVDPFTREYEATVEASVKKACARGSFLAA